MGRSGAKGGRRCGIECGAVSDGYGDGVEFRRRVIAESVATFHRRAFTTDGRERWIPQLDERRTLVLGSSQPETTIDHARCAARGIDVVRRRTGGGAVLVSADDLVWFDLIIERGDPLWTDDVARAFEWVGDVCRSALAAAGTETAMHTGRHVTTPLSPQVCFAGLGAGELTTEGRKVVGISQRRTRSHARFQIAVLRRWDGAEHADLLAVDDTERIRIATELDAVAAGIDISPSALHSLVGDALPS